MIIMECEACNFETEVESCAQVLNDTEEQYYCKICASTFIANATRNDRICENVPLFKTVGYIANMVLAKLDVLETKIDALEKALFSKP